MLPFEILSSVSRAMKLGIYSARAIAYVGTQSLNVNGQQMDSDQMDFTDGFQQFEVFYNDQRIVDQKQDELLEDIKLEKIIKVERYCYSSWGYIPSGIGTVFKMLLLNKAVRDEFIIIHTDKHILITEFNKTFDCKCGELLQDLNKKDEKCLNCQNIKAQKQQLQKEQEKQQQIKKERRKQLKKEMKKQEYEDFIKNENKIEQEQKQQLYQQQKEQEKIEQEREQKKSIQVLIWNYNNEKQKQQILEKYLCFSNKPYNRQLREFKQDSIIKNLRILNFMNLWFFLQNYYKQLQEQGTLTKFTSNLINDANNQFARTQLYFASKDPDHVQTTMESIFGNYSDKPFFLLDPIQLGLSEVVNLGFKKLNDNYCKALQCIITHIERMQITDQISLTSSTISNDNRDDMQLEIDNNQYALDFEQHIQGVYNQQQQDNQQQQQQQQLNNNQQQQIPQNN